MTQQTVVAPPPGPPPAYEFSKTENATIGRAAKWGKALALMFFARTALEVFNLDIIGIVVDLAVGITFWKGAALLEAVVQTEDEDVPKMIGALEQLHTAFTIRILITAIGAAIGLVVSVGFFIQYEFLYEPVEEEPAVTVEDADEEEDEDAAPGEAEEDEAEEDANEDADAEAAAEDGDAAEAADAPAEDAAPEDAPAADAEPAAADTPPA